MVRIRSAKPEDAPGIARVHIASWRSTYRDIVPAAHLAALDLEQYELRWTDILSAAGTTVVAEGESCIVGFGGGGPIRKPLADFTAELYGVYLLEEVQCQGIGTSLLRAVAADLHAGRHRNMAAWVLKANPAVRFYRRSGAIEIAVSELEIGGALLPTVAFGWESLPTLLGGFASG